ncbi:hypothetical protein ASZ90_007913 [hydrocarbon metagenome]|uniref:Uncharacterized protein n=1 Tax=hydrocarbon metagenome TaxID=938273 RepID=A0A0W8FMX2_9ZZZZ
MKRAEELFLPSCPLHNILIMDYSLYRRIKIYRKINCIK